MPIITFIFLVMTLISTTAWADPKYMMPRELVEHARQLGCFQVEDFFDVKGMIGPPYVYGYATGRPEDGAAFWCEKRISDERRFFLVVLVKPVSGKTITCPNLVPWHNYPGGLRVYSGPNESLGDYSYVDAPGQKGPRDGVTGQALESSVPGQSTIFYCHGGRWLFRSRH
jgi:hypothetical protein